MRHRGWIPRQAATLLLALFLGANVTGCSNSTPMVAYVVITGAPPVLLLGQVLPLTATAYDGTNAVIYGVSWNWTNSGPAVTVDKNGVITAAELGMSTITAKGSGGIGQFQFTVVAPDGG
jgi:hypothetical protein